MTPHIPLMAWEPDGDPTRPGVIVAVENLLPTARSYAPEFALDTSTWTTGVVPGGEVCGAALVSYGLYTDLAHVATSSNIYSLWGGTLNLVSRASPAYSAASPDAPWRFASIKDRTLAIQYNNTLQISDSTPFGGVLRDAAGAPKGATMAVQRGFVIVGSYTAPGDPTIADGWICSASEDPEDWTPDIATECAVGQLTATPGVLLRLIPWRDYVIAFKERGVYRGTYVGAARNTWDWPVVSTDVGLIGHDAVCEAEGVMYWMGQTGFYRWAGGAIERIGNAPFEWITRTVFSGPYSRVAVQAAWDSVRRVVRWLFPAAGRIAHSYMIAFHVDSQRWGASFIPAQWMLKATNDFIPDVASGDTSLRFRSVAYFDLNGVFVSHRGAPMASSFTTGDIGDDDDGFAMMRARARMLSAPTTSSVTHYHRMNLEDALTTGATAARVDGKYDVSHSARWHRLKFAQTGRYEATGFRVETPRSGKR